MSHAPGLRIIGGRWRGRRLPPAQHAAVRPTPARLRETLFNWLHYDLAERHCLDLFAGSGALGFEALSRGAAHATFVDRDARLCAELKRRQRQLDAHAISTVACATAAQFINQYMQDAQHAPCTGQDLGARAAQPARRKFDLVFLDPPFASPLRATTLALLARSRDMLGDEALVYVEHPKGVACEAPVGWRLWRRATAASVACVVFAVDAPSR